MYVVNSYHLGMTYRVMLMKHEWQDYVRPVCSTKTAQLPTCRSHI